MIEELLEDIEKIDYKDYNKILFNFYEDKKEYSIEVVFDEDALIIGREDKRFSIEKNNITYIEFLKEVGLTLKKYFKKNKDKYKKYKYIAYGFVDGDLYFIKKPRKKIELIHFSKEDFYSFDSFRLYAWLIVYLNKEGKEKYGKKINKKDFEKLSIKEFHEWCETLALYFDYQKYHKNR